MTKNLFRQKFVRVGGHIFPPEIKMFPERAAFEASALGGTSARYATGIVGPGIKSRGRESYRPKLNRRSTGLTVLSPEFVFNTHKSVYFRKVTTLESVFIYFCTL